MMTVMLAKKTRCASLSEASRLLRAWIEGEDLTMHDMKRATGEVRDGGVLVARVSYNGRLWDVDGHEIREVT